LRQLIDERHAELSISRQCELLGLPRSSRYYQCVEESTENLKIMRLMDEFHLRWPFYGSPRLTYRLNKAGYAVNRKRVQRLMRLMGMEVIYPRPRTSDPHPEHRIYPYLLRNVEVSRVDQVWSADITYYYSANLSSIYRWEFL
jgi:putative transposase